jgi:hypothetical protein
MDLQTVKAQYGTHWAWARTGALILFLLAGMLLAASLTAARNTASADNPLRAGVNVLALLKSGSAG